MQTGGAATGGASGAATNAGASGAGTGGGAPAGATVVYVSGSAPDISIFSLDVERAALEELETVPAGDNPSYLAVSDDRRYLYAANERSMSRVVAFEIDASDGGLREINRQDTLGNGAAHLAVHPSGDWVVVPHYNSGETVVLPVRDDGGISAVSATQRGPSGEPCENAHQAVFDSTGAHLFVPCLGSNYVLQMRFEQGELVLATPPTVAVPGGPRHLALHPTLPFAYVLSELASTVTRLAYAREQGLLSEPISISSVESRPGSSAHIVVHPNGKFLYVSNRTENSLGLFSIDANDGQLTPVAFESGMISTPRDFTLDPSGGLLLSANQGTDQLLVFRIAASDGRLTRESTVEVGARPSYVGVVTLP
jgi:6-phosphogluconolactonase